EFKEEKYFIRDEKPGFYLHKIVNRENQVFHGIVGAASIEAYADNKIKKHEDTIADKEKTLKEHLKRVDFNAEPVLLSYPDNEVLEKIFKKISSKRAEYEFTTTYRDTHYLWVVNDEKDVAEIEKQFAEMEELYIADGHHRSSYSFIIATYLADTTHTHSGLVNYNFI